MNNLNVNINFNIIAAINFLAEWSSLQVIIFWVCIGVVATLLLVLFICLLTRSLRKSKADDLQAQACIAKMNAQIIKQTEQIKEPIIASVNKESDIEKLDFIIEYVQLSDSEENATLLATDVSMPAKQDTEAATVKEAIKEAIPQVVIAPPQELIHVESSIIPKDNLEQDILKLIKQLDESLKSMELIKQSQHTRVATQVPTRPIGARPPAPRPVGARPAGVRPNGSRPGVRPIGARPNGARPNGARPSPVRQSSSATRPNGIRPSNMPRPLRQGEERPVGTRPSPTNKI